MQHPYFCVGGLGGSGTRLVADLLLKHNMPMGTVLNRPFDNLIFSLLFRRPSWFKQFPTNEVVAEAIAVYVRNMTCTTGTFASPDDERYLCSIIDTGDTTIHTPEEWHAHVSSHFSKNKETSPDYSKWGWKEPNTHVFLPHLFRHNRQIKYVHLIRDGIYMMNSKNKLQLQMWKKKFNVNGDNDNGTSIDALNYWIAANSTAVDFGTRNLKSNFYLLNYDVFCMNPEVESIKLLHFLQQKPDDSIITEICSSIQYKKIEPDQRKNVLLNLPKGTMQHFYKVEAQCEQQIATQT